VAGRAVEIVQFVKIGKSQKDYHESTKERKHEKEVITSFAFDIWAL
jgi:hypothetical protein